VHILEAEPGATIAVGFREPISARGCSKPRVAGKWRPVELDRGEAGRDLLHAGAHGARHRRGYRALRDPTEFRRDVSPVGLRPARPIHVDKAVPIAIWACIREPRVRCGLVAPREAGHARQFVTELVRLGAGEAEMPEARGCQLWIAIEGSGTIGSEAYRRGDVWLLPETGGQPDVKASEPSRFLRTWAP